MSDEKKLFILNRIFPNTKSIFGRVSKQIDEIFKDALFVLDTNTLLAPFQTGKENIEKIREVYVDLISKKRLFIPEHVLREFARNRSIKISELYSNIDEYTTKVPSIKPFEYPILGELDEYKALTESRIKVLETIKEYKILLDELKNGITNWNWSDPITSMYSTTFPPEAIILTSSSESDLSKEYNTRLELDIPPGNKDKSKDTNAIGDFLIWKTILELGKKEKKDIIFISQDEKNDWLLKGNSKSISTKYELVHEYYEETGGCNFICMTFSVFLEKQGLAKSITKDFDFVFKFSDSSTFNAPEENKISSGTLESLESIYALIKDFLDNIDSEDGENYISLKISPLIKHFNSAYRNEYFDKLEWENYYSYFYKFSNWLTEIDSFNTEIMYQEQRMKRDTETESIKMIALAKEFVSLYYIFSHSNKIISE